jgi:DDE superfamily endonuclease
MAVSKSIYPLGGRGSGCSSMLLLSSRFAPLLLAFAPVLSPSVWSYVEVLLRGAILTPGKGTVAAALRSVGLGGEQRFQNDRRVLNRACWSGRAASRILLRLLVASFAPCGPLRLGWEDPLERRWGRTSQARDSYRDPGLVPIRTSSKAVACAGSA